jgi:beta-lactamase regulating signal transducer with metallopeptidase domain
MLIELAVKSSLVLIIALAAVAVMRHRSAASRHVVLASAFVATLALPAVVFLGPHWRVPSISQFAKASEQSLTRSVAVPRWLIHSGGSVLPDFHNRSGTSLVRSAGSVDDWVVVLTIVWLIGAVINVIKLFGGILSAERLARSSDPLTNAGWNDSLTALGNSIRVADRVVLRTSARASVPLAWRLGRTCALILPRTAESWQADTRRAVLLHECGHLDRQDCAVRSLAVLACGVWWFNPLAHVALRRLRREQERACDDVVLVAGFAPVDYVRELFEMARRSVTGDADTSAVVAMIRRSELEDRMFAIVDRACRRDPLTPRTRLLAIAVIAALVATLGALRLSAARTPSFTSNATLQASGPGGPAFEWTRAVDEEIRERVANILEAAAGRDSDADVRDVADRALQTIRAMPGGTVVVSSPCYGTCGFGNSTLPAPAAILFEIETKMALRELGSNVDTTRREAVNRLPARYETAIEVFAELLRDPDPQIRSLAAIRLDSVRLPAAVPGWMALLVDSDDSLRERAAISLGAIGDPAAIDALTSVLLNDHNTDVRRQAARSLGLIATGG